jgi:hypothetical protein
MHPFPITARFHESGAFEMSEVTRHFGLYHSQGIGQFADAGFATRQQVQQTQPCRIGQRLEKERRLVVALYFHPLYIYGKTYMSNGLLLLVGKG